MSPKTLSQRDKFHLFGQVSLCGVGIFDIYDVKLGLGTKAELDTCSKAEHCCLLGAHHLNMSAAWEQSEPNSRASIDLIASRECG